MLAIIAISNIFTDFYSFFSLFWYDLNDSAPFKLLKTVLLNQPFNYCSSTLRKGLLKCFSSTSAGCTMLSGSGPTVFGIFESESRARQAMDKITYPAFVCEIGI